MGPRFVAMLRRRIASWCPASVSGSDDAFNLALHGGDSRRSLPPAGASNPSGPEASARCDVPPAPDNALGGAEPEQRRADDLRRPTTPSAPSTPDLRVKLPRRAFVEGPTLQRHLQLRFRLRPLPSATDHPPAAPPAVPRSAGGFFVNADRSEPDGSDAGPATTDGSSPQSSPPSSSDGGSISSLSLSLPSSDAISLFTPKRPQGKAVRFTLPVPDPQLVGSDSALAVDWAAAPSLSPRGSPPSNRRHHSSGTRSDAVPAPPAPGPKLLPSQFLHLPPARLRSLLKARPS
eukprot:EG_transcript_5059